MILGQLVWGQVWLVEKLNGGCREKREPLAFLS